MRNSALFAAEHLARLTQMRGHELPHPANTAVPAQGNSECVQQFSPHKA
jgi:hypothetical protein